MVRLLRVQKRPFPSRSFLVNNNDTELETLADAGRLLAEPGRVLTPASTRAEPDQTESESFLGLFKQAINVR